MNMSLNFIVILVGLGVLASPFALLVWFCCKDKKKASLQTGNISITAPYDDGFLYDGPSHCDFDKIIVSCNNLWEDIKTLSLVIFRIGYVLAIVGLIIYGLFWVCALPVLPRVVVIIGAAILFMLIGIYKKVS